MHIATACFEHQQSSTNNHEQATGGRGANLIVNNVGGSAFAECVRALAFAARFATLGHVDGMMKAEIDIEHHLMLRPWRRGIRGMLG